jgi:hypothetical protein
LAVRLPSEILRGGPRDGSAQVGVGNTRELVPHFVGQRHLGWLGARLVALGGALGSVDEADAEPKRIHAKPSRPELLDDGGRKERQLLGPGCARSSDQ